MQILQRSPERIGANIFNAASAPVRMQILRLLSTKGALPYTEIMFALKLDPVRDAGKFVYHLKSLTDAGLMVLNKKAKKYEITELGEMVVGYARDLEEYVNVKRGKLYVRTSRLAIEEFHRTKIARSLAVEAGVPQELADEIAAEAEDRLIRLRSTYLTAPLIREFVNAILIEKKLEEYRHKLTRLGLPVYDVSQLLKNLGERQLTADSFHRSAGGTVMAEYVLLDCLPHEIADAHLSGTLHIANLDNWVLKPNEVQHDLRYFLKNGLANIKPPETLEAALALAGSVFRLCSSEVSGEQSFDMFNLHLSPFVEDKSYEELTELISMFLSSIRQDFVSNNPTPGLTLGFEFSIPDFLKSSEALGPGGRTLGVYEDFKDEADTLLDASLEAVSRASIGKPLLNPRFVFKLRDGVMQNDESRQRLAKAHSLAANHGLPYFALLSEKSNDCYSATGFRLNSDWSGAWEADCARTGSMDTVFLNLPRVAYEAKKSDDKFLALLRSAAEMAVEAFRVKRRFMLERLKQPLLPLLAGAGANTPYFYEKNSAYNLAVIGLAEGTEAHLGGGFEREKGHQDFALKFLEELAGYLKGRSEELGMRLSLAQRPGDDASTRLAELDLEKYGRGAIVSDGVRGHPFYTDMPTLPLSVKVPLENRLEVEGRFQRAFGGGHLQLTCIMPPSLSSEALVNLTKQAKQKGNMFMAFTSNFSYCKTCNKTESGIMPRCSICGSDTLTPYGRSSATFLPLALWPEGKRRALEKRVSYTIT